MDIINNLREGIEDDIVDMLNEMTEQEESKMEEEEEVKLTKTKKGTTDTAKATIENDLSNGSMDLEEEVQCLVGGTSEKYVPQPKWEDILTDVVQAMRKFKQDVRWKDFHRQDKEEQERREKQMQKGKGGAKKKEKKTKICSEEGMKTGLKPVTINLTAPRASELVEGFITQLQRTLLKQLMDKRDSNKSNDKTQQIRMLQKKLKATDMVVVPTDKTNSFKMISKEEYIKQVKAHLAKSGKEIKPNKLTEVKGKAEKLLDELLPIISEKEAWFLQQSIKSKAIPTPKLLIKDHKDPDELNNYPTRLVVPANNFTSAFPKLGYMGIKKIFDDNKINYKKRTIIQASDLKEKIEKMGITSENSTIVSIDAEEFYPSIKFKLVKKAVNYFAKNLSKEDKNKIEQCLEMVKFGMSSTLLTFVDQYYEYDGEEDSENKGLTIGGYESAWFADLAGAYVLEKTQQHFKHSRYHGMYRDDGFGVLIGKWTYQEVVNWRNSFQDQVNKVVGGELSCNSPVKCG